MDLYTKWQILFLVYSAYILGNGVIYGDDPDCPRPKCDPRNNVCPYKTFYADISTGKICRWCNICIKQGSPVDSEGCPQLPCPKALPKGACYQPRFYNSWVRYHGKRCQTCEARLCNM